MKKQQAQSKKKRENVCMLLLCLQPNNVALLMGLVISPGSLRPSVKRQQ